jgi:hypothetical protein
MSGTMVGSEVQPAAANSHKAVPVREPQEVVMGRM